MQHHPGMSTKKVEKKRRTLNEKKVDKKRKNSKKSLFSVFFAYFSKSPRYIGKDIKKEITPVYRFFRLFSRFSQTFFCRHAGVILQKKRKKSLKK